MGFITNQRISAGLVASCAAFGIFATLTFAPGIADAGVVYDTALADPPGVFFGAGNANTNFTIDDETYGPGTIELGLSAITRYVGPIVPSPSNSDTYVAPVGTTAVPGKSGAVWGVDFSINLENSGLYLSDVYAVLTLSDSHTSGGGSADPLLIPDNALYGTSPNYTAAQNSEALSYAGIASALGDPDFDLNAAATYTFTLDLYQGSNDSGPLLASDTIVVDAVPEPASLSVFGVALIGLWGFTWARRRKAS